jgi:CDP-paratose 2-epimerase
MKSRILITGGAGFIGSNAAAYFIRSGWDVTILDNLWRTGTELNLEWLKGVGQFHFLKADIRDEKALSQLFKNERYDFILHLAAQVAVTTSVLSPREDFEINALGTFNLLEAVREYNPEAFILFASTNKVYGKLDHLKVEEKNNRWSYLYVETAVSEKELLDFHSPYGCSKGAADQYVIDYARIYGLNTCVFRQSCIYGQRQFGIEDQGWVAWFAIASLLGRQFSIYGDGKQVRDVLFIDDLVQAYKMAYINKIKVSGNAFNIGGGPKNTLSLLELIEVLETQLGLKLSPKFDEWRPGDQKVYVSDISKFSYMTDWKPNVDVNAGVTSLIDWVRENQSIFK